MANNNLKTAKVTGTVLGGSGVYLECSQVQIVNLVTKEAKLLVTEGWPSTNRNFEFNDLLAGRYQITIPSMDGFDPVNIELTEGETKNVTMRINPIKISQQFKKPGSKTMAELSQIKSQGVSVVEVSDYVFGNYQGELKYPPNADGNPKKAYIIFWKNFSHRFIFAHECSYCPLMELPSGAGVCYQFFEGNEGKAELFNAPGRRERNTYVEIMESGPERVWVRWIYFGVNQDTGEQYYRGTEDFWAYPNGYIVRKQTYTSLVDSIHGHTREPIENIGMCPVGKTWVDVLKKVEKTGEYHALVVLDAFSKNRYNVFWKHKPGSLYGAIPRRTGASWKELDDAAGVVFVLPMKDGAPFCIFGDASGFRHDFTRIKEHSHIDTGGVGWIGQCWDHWPIGWLNSQGHEVDAESLKKYPNHFSPGGMDFFALPNEEAEKGVFYSLMGVGTNNMEDIRSLASKWLKGNKDVITSLNIDSVADLPPLKY